MAPSRPRPISEATARKAAAGSTSGTVDYASTTWAWEAVVAETGVENLLRLDVIITRPGSDDVIRSVTGFIGEPIVPGQSNQAWATSGQQRDGQRR